MLFVRFVQRTLMSIITVFKKTLKASLTVQPLQLSEFIAAWYSDLVRTQLDEGSRLKK